MHVKLGITTYLSGLQSLEDLFLRDERLQDLGYEYHLISGIDLNARDLDALAKRRNKLVLTVHARKENAVELIELYSSHNACLCIVSGRAKDASPILGIIEKAVRLCGNEIWVGVRKTAELVKPLIQEYGLTSLHFNSAHLKEDVATFPGRKAVFTRFLFNYENEDADGLKKRNVVFGLIPDFKKYFSELEEMHVDVLVGCPEKQEKKELEDFISVR